jgi:hypothetical protein
VWPVVELVSYSDDQYANATTHHPYFQNVLAYAVIWRGIPCVEFSVPPDFTPQPTPPNQPAAKCDDLFFVAAKTGKPIGLSYANEDPPG